MPNAGRYSGRGAGAWAPRRIGIRHRIPAGMGSDIEFSRNSVSDPNFRRSRRSVFLAAIALRQLLLIRVLGRRRADHRADDLHVRFVAAVRHEVPLLAVPRLDHCRVRTLVVLARRLDRLHEAHHAKLLDRVGRDRQVLETPAHLLDRKSTRLNSSHSSISYAVFCLKKKNTDTKHTTRK